MGYVLIFLSVLCFAYYIFLQILHVDFALIWLGAALVLGVGGGWNLWLRARHLFLPGAGKVFLAAVIGAGIFIFLGAELLIVSKMFQKPEEALDYVIVLGAQVKGDRPSLSLQKRIAVAEWYLREHPGTIAVLSGGQGPGEHMTEASCMQQQLLAMGISGERLLLESRSTSTQENLQYSGLRAPVKESNTGIITQNFHMYRSLKLAQKQGYEKVSGIAAGGELIFQPHFMVREAFALMKEKLVGNL